MSKAITQPASRAETSPLNAYLDHLRSGELAYQFDPETSQAVFYPRVAAPGHGGPLEWRISSGLGTVHATTVVHPRNAPTHNVSLIDCDEGFRLMSTVLGIDPADVKIGMRVRFQAEVLPDDDPRPVFYPVENS